MSQPPSYGVVGFALKSQEHLLQALSLRPWFREDSSLASERRASPSTSQSLHLALSALRANAFNVVLSDRLCADVGFGWESVFAYLHAPAGADLPLSHPAIPPSHTSDTFPDSLVVAPWQVLNHMPNSPALTNKAGLIRSLYRYYKTLGEGGAATPHVFE